MDTKLYNDKNIILLTIDCLRADHLYCMRYNKEVTPTIDNLAKNGVLFTNAFANAPYTPYSIPSFITSKLPPVKNFETNIAEVLKKNGYSTAAFNPNPIIFSDSFQGCDIRDGFDVYDIMLNYKMRFNLVIGGLRAYFMRYFIRSFDKKSHIFRVIYSVLNKFIKTFPTVFYPKEYLNIPNADKINQRAFSWIKNQKGKFFLWLHYMDVHDPYAPLSYENQSELLYLITKYRDFPNMLTKQEIDKLIILYDLEIKVVDNAIKNLVNNLKELNLIKNSIIIISADHGEEFGEHDAYGHGQEFKPHLYDECIHVPLIIYGIEEKGIIIDKQVQLLDLSPTICELLNLPIPTSFLGKSLFKDDDKGIIIISEFEIAYRTKDYKLIISKSSKDKNELYDLKNDPFEKNNIYKNSKFRQKAESDMISILKNYYKRNELKNIIKK